MPKNAELEKRIEKLERELRRVRDLYVESVLLQETDPEAAHDKRGTLPRKDRSARSPRGRVARNAGNAATFSVPVGEPEPALSSDSAPLRSSRVSTVVAAAIGALLMLASWWNGHA